MSGTGSRLYWAIAVLALAGLADSALALRLHYAKSATSFCDVGENFNCDIVNRSVYAKLFGIPVALIGMVGYAALAGIAVFRRSHPDTSGVLLLAAALGLGFAVYLTYVEAYLLSTWCILCLISLALIFMITVLAALAYFFRRRASVE
ncbi:MAG: hypothetical protein H0X25_05275 [Acidobacteriales bacterium]|nr:hypothetical protein [Terriglobales bacterium]